MKAFLVLIWSFLGVGLKKITYDLTRISVGYSCLPVKCPLWINTKRIAFVCVKNKSRDSQENCAAHAGMSCQLWKRYGATGDWNAGFTQGTVTKITSIWMESIV